VAFPLCYFNKASSNEDVRERGVTAPPILIPTRGQFHAQVSYMHFDPSALFPTLASVVFGFIYCVSYLHVSANVLVLEMLKCRT
jgi:hypothetical protein